MKILITGCAGFIGFYVTKYFLDKGHYVLGLDNLNSYYDIKLKKGCGSGCSKNIKLYT